MKEWSGRGRGRGRNDTRSLHIHPLLVVSSDPPEIRQDLIIHVHGGLYALMMLSASIFRVGGEGRGVDVHRDNAAGGEHHLCSDKIYTAVPAYGKAHMAHCFSPIRFVIAVCWRFWADDS